MDYVREFLHIEGTIGQGAFGRVLVTSPLQNQSPLQLGQLTKLTNGTSSPPNSGHSVANHHSQEDQASPNVTLQQVQTETTIIHEDSSISFSTSVRGNNSSNKTHSAKSTDKANARFALKCVHPILKPQRLANELRHLRDLGGQCNVVQMHTAHFNMGSLYIVMELIEHNRFVEFVANLDYGEIVLYMKNLLIALEHVHSKNIMHRDIKPANFLFNRKDRKFLLVDFGLAQSVRPRSVLFGNRSNTSSSGSSNALATPMTYLPTPTTPTSISSARRMATPLFPEPIENRKEDLEKRVSPQNSMKTNVPFVNLNSARIIHNKSPARHFINLTTVGSPRTPNMSTKRQLQSDIKSNNDFNQMLKKLRVSNHDDSREPVKLTVGAYESPITTNDSGSRRNVNHNHKFSTPIIPSRRTTGTRCDCRARPRTCSICLSRPESNAPKSGTPGFKAPEVLLRYTNQSTAIDIWSAGVIMACLLSGHSPFFRDVDDNVSLAEVITILGSQKVTQAAKCIGIKLNIEPKREPVDLAQLCRTIRRSNQDKRQIDIPDIAFDLLQKMLDPNPLTRITASEGLKHPWFDFKIEP